VDRGASRFDGANSTRPSSWKAGLPRRRSGPTDVIHKQRQIATAWVRDRDQRFTIVVTEQQPATIG
jgi:hypothetical protein